MGLTFFDLAAFLLPEWFIKVLVYYLVTILIFAPLFGLWAWGTYLANRNLGR